MRLLPSVLLEREEMALLLFSGFSKDACPPLFLPVKEDPSLRVAFRSR